MARKHLGRHVRTGGGIDFSIDGEHPVRRSFQGGPVEDRDHGFRALAVVDGPIGSEGALEAVGAPQQCEIDRGLAEDAAGHDGAVPGWYDQRDEDRAQRHGRHHEATPLTPVLLDDPQQNGGGQVQDGKQLHAALEADRGNHDEGRGQDSNDVSGGDQSERGAEFPPAPRDALLHQPRRDGKGGADKDRRRQDDGRRHDTVDRRDAPRRCS